MEYVYKDQRIRDLFENDGAFRKRYGQRAVKRRDMRLNEIANAKNLAELLRIGGAGPGRWHVLDGRDGGTDKGKISGDLTGNYRMLLAPPVTPFGTTVTVEIVQVKDTHK